MTTALLVMGMQQGMVDRIAAGRSVAPEGVEETVAGLLATFRKRGLPVIHVLQHSPNPQSAFHETAPGARPLNSARPLLDEPVLAKSASSAFAGTGLDAELMTRNVDRLVIAGAVAGYCVTSTVRIAADLGYRVVVPEDGVMSFDIPALGGGRVDARTVLLVTLSLLNEDYAQVMPAADIGAAL